MARGWTSRTVLLEAVGTIPAPAAACRPRPLRLPYCDGVRHARGPSKHLPASMDLAAACCRPPPGELLPEWLPARPRAAERWQLPRNRFRGPRRKAWNGSVLLGVLWVWLLIPSAPARADEDRVLPLPAVEPVDRGFFSRIRLAALGDPQDLTEPLLPDDVAPPGQPPQESTPPGRKLPPGAKPGPLQQLIFTATELPRLGDDGLGLTTLDTSLTIGMPAPTVDSPLLLTPGFGWTFVDETNGPTDPGLPATLYETWLQARWMRKIGKRLGVDLAVAPGWYSDFVNDSAQAFRVTGHGFGAWEVNEDVRIAAGVIYLDRYDVNLLPAGGLIWTPRADRRFELVFPRPRLAWRVAENAHASQWMYLAGEFGGNQWAVRRDSGADDIVVYHDYRLLFGWERRPADLGMSWRLETGWVTGRLLEYYGTDTSDYRPDDTFLVRLGMWY